MNCGIIMEPDDLSRKQKCTCARILHFSYQTKRSFVVNDRMIPTILSFFHTTLSNHQIITWTAFLYDLFSFGDKVLCKTLCNP